MVRMVALPFQVAQLTDSLVAVGLIGLAELVLLILFGLCGGAMADAVDRGRVVIATQFASLGSRWSCWSTAAAEAMGQ
jgi:hypothetical protein